ncbi:hypothetical protein DAPPUDRAFT_304644 [Daphnia pulex]|uniref:Uncharacterized protein n=1 Tax=Daphnia pulex TaxID=6669 RepID=E9FUB1_DAPPU|nr:hypothetical protein DAPPUDRAFT_304644 [Daphnia pulex]|eukprot:EFX88950.1 hypothetical protein DAPPUDRAFT_304644 [Daphnia pulex]
MRLELPLLLVFLACAASEAFNPYVGEQYPYYYNNPSYYRADDAEELRQMMFSLGLPARQTTVTVTTTVRPTFSFPTLSMPTLPPLRQTITSRLTSFSTITCTKSTDVPCPAVVKKTSTADLMAGTSGSQKNTTAVADVEVEEEDDAVQQFAAVTPTVVQKVETTKVPTQKVPNKKVPNRKGRDIESELLSLLSPDFYDDYLENQPHDIQSAFHTGPYNPVPLPFFRTYQPAPNIAQLRQSSFFALLGSLFTGRSTITVFGIKTSTLTPTCSVAGPIPQCPNN